MSLRDLGNRMLQRRISKEPILAANGEAHDQASYSSRYVASRLSRKAVILIGFKVYRDVLCTLEGDPLVGMTSPPLMGSSGVVPLTIIAPLPDICRHMSNCIARAEREVFLATNYWQSSDASTLITNSLKELSRRAGERRQRVIVKIMYDRGNAKQVCSWRLRH